MAQSVSELSVKPAKAVTAWLTDQIAPAYWKPNSLILVSFNSRRFYRACEEKCTSHSVESFTEARVLSFFRDVTNVESHSRIMTQSTIAGPVEKVSVTLALLKHGRSLREAGVWHLCGSVMPAFKTEGSLKVNYTMKGKFKTI